MSFETFYRISFYLMLFLATLALNIDAAGDFPLAPLYPLAVAAAGVVALLTVDRNPARGLPRDIANLLAIVSILPGMLEYMYDEYLLVLGLGHWLVFLQLIKMFLPKTIEDDWFLFLLGLTQVVVGAFLPGERIGLVIVLWALASLWTLALFHLRREALRPPVGGAPMARLDPVPDPREPYPGLVDRAFLFSATKVALLTLALGGFIFLLMPRWDMQSRNRRGAPAVGSHLTGFSDQVRLGQMGEILESEDVVMSIELYDEQEQRIEPAEEMLWRGVALSTYEGGRWLRLRPDPRELDETDLYPELSFRQIRQQIRLESTANEILFALRPILRAEGRDLLLNGRDGTLYRSDLRPRESFRTAFNRNPGAFDYVVISNADSSARQPGEQVPRRNGTLDSRLLAVPEDLRQAIDPLVASQVASLAEDDLEGRARALEAYLRDSGLFTYTLRMEVQDPTIDPNADFLLNRKSGHCEYYASALALMCRSAGIPARIVNGFKGGDWNDLGQVLVVRKKHAHSWVEALVGQDLSNGRPIWITLDGTPPEARDEVVAQVGTGRRFRGISDYLRYLWVFYVVGFDAQRQDRVIYEPIRDLFREARRGFVLMATNFRAFLRGLLSFPTGRSFFSVRGFVVSVTALLLVVLLLRVGRWLFRRLIHPFRRSARGNMDLASAVASYRRLVQILSQIGLERPPAETPREFARRTATILAARGRGGVDLADVPPEVVDVFYRIRFGGQTPGPDELELMEHRLDTLESGLRPPS